MFLRLNEFHERRAILAGKEFFKFKNGNIIPYATAPHSNPTVRESGVSKPRESLLDTL